MRIAEAQRWLNDHLNLEGNRATRNRPTGSGTALPTAGATDGLSLEAMTELMTALGDPQDAFRTIHVSGTNGKGSVVRFCDAMLRGLGLSVARYTSPHLERLNERIAWDGRAIGDDDLAATLSLIAGIEHTLSTPPSYFEILTAAALTWFADVGAETAVVEVGLLGRYDATNVVHADVAVITNVGKDHTDGAGDWRRRVAEEKAGIIEPDSHVILGWPQDEVTPIFESEPHRHLWIAGRDFEVVDDQLGVGGHLVTVSTPHGVGEPLFVPLHGAYQPANLATAVAAVDAFLGRSVDAEVVTESLREIEMPGRFEIARREPTVILEGAHNPDGAAAARATLDREFARLGSWILVIGLLEGRDPGEMLQGFGAADFDAVIVTAPTWDRAMPADRLAEAARREGIAVEVVTDPDDAIRRAISVAGHDDLVLVAGSLYLVGEVRRTARSVDPF